MTRWQSNLGWKPYRSFAGGKGKYTQELFIELFDTDLVTVPESLPEWFVEECRMWEEEQKQRFIELHGDTSG
ncbi:hypothetical protein LPJ66_010646 [Kickxella alabastrina]|uniref:Uncharacterized protein n=1 Tax=Kickxella alabastrina TaxID=61397 RepID=A0ACC1I0D4_9FUNG|nr:hypothetical protein LPJ66_010646 [Kickxella alabastrina]